MPRKSAYVREAEEIILASVNRNNPASKSLSESAMALIGAFDATGRLDRRLEEMINDCLSAFDRLHPDPHPLDDLIARVWAKRAQLLKNKPSV